MEGACWLLGNWQRGGGRRKWEKERIIVTAKGAKGANRRRKEVENIQQFQLFS